MEEKRKYERQCIIGVTIDINDGSKVFCHCDVIDVSMGGIKVENIHKLIMDTLNLNENSKMVATINDPDGKIVRINLKPRWIKHEQNSPYITVGFSIIETIQTWFDFIRKHTSLYVKRKNDVWGISGHKYLKD